MGVRRAGDGELVLPPDDSTPGQLAEKRALLATRRDELVVGELDPAYETWQDDVVVLTRDDHGRFVMTAGCVCFPSYWSPRAKLGLPLSAIHGPVPRYEEELRRKVDTFVDRMPPGAVFVRRNWTIHEDAELCKPHPAPPADLSIAPDDLLLRSERQALRVDPATGELLFTIRTQQVPIAVVARNRGIARRLADRLAAQPPDRAYSPHVPALVRRLRS